MFVVFYCGPILSDDSYMGVSKNRDIPKKGWFMMEIPIKMDDLGGKPTILGTTYMFQSYRSVCFVPFLNRPGSPSVSWAKNGRKEP